MHSISKFGVARQSLTSDGEHGGAILIAHPPGNMLSEDDARELVAALLEAIETEPEAIRPPPPRSGRSDDA